MISRELEALASDLAAVSEQRVTLDLDDLNPPALYVALDRIDTWNIAHGAELHLTIWAIAPASTETAAYRSLDVLLPAAQAAMEALELPQTGPIEATTIAPSVPGEPLPALKIPTSIHTTTGE